MKKQDSDLRAKAQILLKECDSIRCVAQKLKVSTKFVETWKKRENSKRKHGSGRPSKLNTNVLQKIKRCLTNKKNNSIRKTAAKVGLSNSSIVRARKKLHLKHYRIGKTTFLSDKHKQKGLQFAKKNKNRNWKNVLFCDETSIKLQQSVNPKNNVQYAKSRNEVKPIETFKHPVKVHAVSGISWYGKTRLHVFSENLDADLYIKILNNIIIPDARKIFGNSEWVLLQDNDPKHTEESKGIFNN